VKSSPSRTSFLLHAMCFSVPGHIQSDSRGKIRILDGDSIGHCEKKVHMNMCLIVSGHRDRAV
jgi:hypothetical protein